MNRHQRILSLVAIAAGFTFAGVARADERWGPITADEAAMLAAGDADNHLRARELAEAYLRDHPESAAAHLALARAHHYAEANPPSTVFHARRARELVEERTGGRPSPADEWRIHAQALLLLADDLSELERYEDALDAIEDHDALYNPKLAPRSAWPLMKLRRYDEARRVAQQALASPELRVQSIGHNSLCAIEFEAGRPQASYDACMAALEFGRKQPNGASIVDLTNAAEAARALFRLAETETLLVEASRLRGESWGNPWNDLAELYLREGRYAEALGATREIPGYLASRSPSMRGHDDNEVRKTLISIFLVLGETERAARVAGEALARADRRAQTSRDPEQDLAVTAFMDATAQRLLRIEARERRAARPFYERWWSWLGDRVDQARGYWAGRTGVRALRADGQLAGIVRISRREAAALPVWMVFELVRPLGVGVVAGAIAEAREADDRPGAAAYYDAFQCLIDREEGDLDGLLAHAESALEGLPEGERIIRSYVHALRADALCDDDRCGEALSDYEAVLRRDPGVFRRLDRSLPIRPRVSGAEGDALLDALVRSGRFRVEDEGLPFSIAFDGGQGRACLHDRGDGVVACGRREADAREAAADEDEDEADAPRPIDTLLADTIRRIFSPPIDFRQADLRGLDGSLRVVRGDLSDALHLLDQL